MWQSAPSNYPNRGDPMPVSKLKNIAILILLGANLILLGFLVPNRMNQEYQEAELKGSLAALYAAEDVTLNADAVPETRTLYALQLASSTSAQVRAATALLGDQPVAQTDPAGWLSSFSAAAGTCSIGRNGAFQARLTGLDMEPALVLEEMGCAWTHRIQAGQAITVTQTVLEVPVFSDGLTLTYEGGLLTAIDGVFFCGADSPVRISQEACMSAADALVLFLDRRFDLGWVGSAVTSLEQGYLQADTASAANVQLTPVWKLATDTDTFLIDGLTGEISSVS